MAHNSDFSDLENGAQMGRTLSWDVYITFDPNFGVGLLPTSTKTKIAHLVVTFTVVNIPSLKFSVYEPPL